MESIQTKLKQAIIADLNLEDIKAEDIDDTAPLFVDGLGLDSLDAVELVVILQKHFGIVMQDADVAKKAFASINALAAFIQEHSPKA